MTWAYMQVELRPEDALATPMFGTEPGMTYEAARAEVQALLDRSPALAEVADTWRRAAKDDTVFAGPFTWTVFQYEDDPRVAAIAWLEDYVAPMRAAGLDVQVDHPTP